MRKQRTLSSLLALCLLLTLLPVRAAAENETGTPETAETAQTLPAEESPAEEPQAPGEDPVVELASVTIPEGGVSGQCGDSLTWTLTENGTLTITGSGAMWDYDDPSTSSSNRAPWYTYTHTLFHLIPILFKQLNIFIGKVFELELNVINKQDKASL